MNIQLKNYLAIAGTVTLLAIALSVVWYVNAYSRSIEPSTFRSFGVSGEGRVFAVPDVAKFTFRVITQGGQNISSLQEENSQKTSQAVEFLKENGVLDEDITTQGFDIQPRYQYFNCDIRPLSSPSTQFESSAIEPCPPPEIVGYTVSQSVSVKARDLDNAGELLSGVVDAGANSVSGLTFVIDDPESVRAEAREKAIDQAMEKAEEIADAANFRVGRLLAIEESGGPRAFFGEFEERALADSASAPRATPVVEPGSQEIIITVHLRYEIK